MRHLLNDGREVLLDQQIRVIFIGVDFETAHLQEAPLTDGCTVWLRDASTQKFIIIGAKSRVMFSSLLEGDACEWMLRKHSRNLSVVETGDLISLQNCATGDFMILTASGRMNVTSEESWLSVAPTEATRQTLDAPGIDLYGIFRDSANYLQWLHDTLLTNRNLTIGSLFAYENDSKDDSAELLRNWSASTTLPTVFARTGTDHVESFGSVKLQQRCEWLATCRNRLVSMASGAETREFALLIDADVYFEPEHVQQLIQVLQQNAHVAMACAYVQLGNKGHYYDQFALVDNEGVHDDFCPFERCQERRCMLARSRNTERRIIPARYGNLIPVRSAFGGLAVVRSKHLRQARWDTIIGGQSSVTCEHWEFCRHLRQRCGSVVIVPWCVVVSGGNTAPLPRPVRSLAPPQPPAPSMKSLNAPVLFVGVHSSLKRPSYVHDFLKEVELRSPSRATDLSAASYRVFSRQTPSTTLSWPIINASFNEVDLDVTTDRRDNECRVVCRPSRTLQCIKRIILCRTYGHPCGISQYVCFVHGTDPHARFCRSFEQCLALADAASDPTLLETFIFHFDEMHYARADLPVCLQWIEALCRLATNLRVLVVLHTVSNDNRAFYEVLLRLPNCTLVALNAYTTLYAPQTSPFRHVLHGLPALSSTDCYFATHRAQSIATFGFFGAAKGLSRLCRLANETGLSVHVYGFYTDEQRAAAYKIVETRKADVCLHVETFLDDQHLLAALSQHRAIVLCRQNEEGRCYSSGSVWFAINAGVPVLAEYNQCFFGVGGVVTVPFAEMRRHVEAWSDAQSHQRQVKRQWNWARQHPTESIMRRLLEIECVTDAQRNALLDSDRCIICLGKTCHVHHATKPSDRRIRSAVVARGAKGFEV